MTDEERRTGGLDWMGGLCCWLLGLRYIVFLVPSHGPDAFAMYCPPNKLYLLVGIYREYIAVGTTVGKMRYRPRKSVTGPEKVLQAPVESVPDATWDVVGK